MQGLELGVSHYLILIVADKDVQGLQHVQLQLLLAQQRHNAQYGRLPRRCHLHAQRRRFRLLILGLFL